MRQGEDEAVLARPLECLESGLAEPLTGSDTEGWSDPARMGVPILHLDSLGLYTNQFEYDEWSWSAIATDQRFTKVEEVTSSSGLTDQTSAMPFATGCAMVHLNRR